MASVTADDNTKDTNGGLMEQKLRLWREEKEYGRIYVSLISEEEESDMETKELLYSYFG